MILRLCGIVVAAVGLAACQSASVARDLGGVETPAVRSYNVARLEIDVPAALTVSERNLVYPGADIVWRGEPPGDRHRQVRRIFEDGMAPGAAALDGDRDVTVDIEVVRFHSLTERARYGIGGVHSIRYILTVRDAASGEIVEGPRRVATDLAAFGGERALQAERAGQTQRVRIVDHLRQDIRRQLGDTPPDAAGG